MENHSPSQNPNLGMNRVASSRAPPPSRMQVPMRAWRTTRTTPDMRLRFMAEAIMSRWDRPIRRRRAKGTTEMRVTKPRPPSCSSSRITSCPNQVQCTAVSTITSPVTQVAEVAVNRQVSHEVGTPSRAATGRWSSRAPSRMIAPNPSTMYRVGFNFFCFVPEKPIKRSP